MKERIQNIQQQEETLDKMESLITEFEAVAEKWQQLQLDYIKLIEYYDSKQWIKDYDSSNKGELPPIKCGVLSQDAVYNLIMRVKALSEKLSLYKLII